MSYAQGARIGLGSVAAINPSSAYALPWGRLATERRGPPADDAAGGDAPRPWEAGALRAPALKMKNNDERTL